jgi:hypothetical protein
MLSVRALVLSPLALGLQVETWMVMTMRSSLLAWPSMEQA